MNCDLPVLDLHLHLAAVSPADTDGGWFSPRRMDGRLFRWLRKRIGLASTKNGLDAEFRRIVGDLLEDARRLAKENGFAGFAAAGLAFDWAHDDHGRADENASVFHVPDAYALRTAAEINRRNNAADPPLMVTALSIHPYRADALTALHAGADAGALLVKWLPPAHNIDPADPRTVQFARECKALGMPLLIHTGTEARMLNAHPRWNDPTLLRPLLNTGATVIAAHMGMAPSARYFDEWTAMLGDWPNLYGDTAALPLFFPWPRRLIRALDRPFVADRILHGSDWPVPSWVGSYWPMVPAAALRRLSRIGNRLWRDVAAKLAAGLPKECFTRAWGLLPGHSPHDNLPRQGEKYGNGFR